MRVRNAVHSLFSLNNELTHRQTTSKILRRPLARINALRAPLINRIHHVALISLCHSADRRDDLARFACIGLSTNTSPPSFPCTFR